MIVASLVFLMFLGMSAAVLGVILLIIAAVMNIVAGVGDSVRKTGIWIFWSGCVLLLILIVIMIANVAGLYSF